MSPPLVHWRITRDATNDEADAILSQDPVWNCFALADLEPPLRDYSQFVIASQDESSERAICLILRHPIIGQVLSPFGRREGVAAILKQLALPERPLIQAQEIHIRCSNAITNRRRPGKGCCAWRSPQPHGDP